MAGKKTKKNKKNQQADKKQVAEILWSTGLLLSGIFLFLCLPGLMGGAGNVLKNILTGLFGICGYILPLFLICTAVLLFFREKKFISKTVLTGTLLVCLSAFMNVVVYEPPVRGGLNFFEYFAKLTSDLYIKGTELSSGGAIGGLLGVFLSSFLSSFGAGFVLILMLGILIFFLSGLSFTELIGKGREKAVRKKDDLFAAHEAKKAQPEPEEKTKPAEEKKIKPNGRTEFVIPDVDVTEADKKWSFLSEKQPAAEEPELTVSASDFETEEDDPLKDATILSADNKPAEKSVPPKEAASAQNAEETPEAAYQYPDPELLNFKPSTSAAGDAEMKNTARKLIEVLKSFNVEARVINVSKGPTVTRYELQPSAGVRINKITNLADDIALSLAAKGVRIEAPIPGKAAIGIEIPNNITSVVYLKELIASPEFKAEKSAIGVSLGKDISGSKVVVDLAKMPHLLIAGSTGSGKSVCVNSLILSLLFRASPKEVKLILVDPKMVELNVYNGIPHLLIPVVTDPKKAAGALNWAVGEMLKRYEMFKEKGVRDFKGYNAALDEGEEALPQIVIIIDEMADLMMTSPTEVEDAVCRIAQMARAAGMHLIVATQRPSADVITGLIKTNIPSRIAFAVAAAIDSRIILDTQGAEKLIGRGDMLYSPMGAPKPIRVQGCLVTDDEVERVVSFIKETSDFEYDQEIQQEVDRNAKELANKGKKATAADADGEEDEMLPAAIEVVVESGQASTSVLQRKLKLGYSRAARIVDQLEARGIIGPFQGSKPRSVLITKQQWYEMKNRGEE